jgi:REP element-mobilizing transposase RayT
MADSDSVPELAAEEPLRRPNSIRLMGWDYGSAGLYFVTIGVQGRQSLLGRLGKGAIDLSDAGRIVARCWTELLHHFPQVALDEWVVMPDHFHGIVSIDGVCPHRRGEAGRAPTTADTLTTATTPALGDIIGSFKSASTRSIRLKLDAPDLRVWQRGYHDRIIRNAEELDRVRKYIMENPHRG